MNRNLRTVLIAVLALVFAVSAARVGYQLIQYEKGDRDYSEAEALVNLPELPQQPEVLPPVEEQPDASQQTEPDAQQLPPQEQQPEDTEPAPEDAEPAPQEPVYVDPYAEALAAMDFAALREVNSDVLGWILIPGTKVSYPLVQGEDNDYYLNHTWKKSRSAVGAIFLETQCSSDMTDLHTIIYGHRMRNGSMFAGLSNYKQQSYWSKNPSVYITTDTGSYRFDIFAAYEADVTGHTYTLNPADWQAYIDESLAQSVIDTGVVPSAGEQIITLSTCTGDGYDTRWVVQAVLRGLA